MIIHIDKHFVYPSTKSQQLYVILFTKCHPSLFGIPPQAEEMDKVGFYSMLNFLLAQKPMAELWLPKVSGEKKHRTFQKPFVMDGSEWSLGTLQNWFSVDFGDLFFDFLCSLKWRHFPKKTSFLIAVSSQAQLLDSGAWLVKGYKDQTPATGGSTNALAEPMLR